MWENTLLCQFHDCLPGSCIEMCYDDSGELYAKVFQTGERVRSEALKALGVADEYRSGYYPEALNTLPWHRAELVKISTEFLNAWSSSSKYALLRGNTGLVKPQRWEEMRAGTQNENQADVTATELKPGIFQLENKKLRVVIENGVITSLFDRLADREIVAKNGKAGQLVIFDDKPLYWQAWDVEVFHLESRKELRSSQTAIAEADPLRASVVTTTKVSDKSWVKTTISLAAAIDDNPSFVEFESEVEWQETMKFLKVEFPVDITNTEASYETQYGIIRRPTH